MPVNPHPLVDSALCWFDQHARELPWRNPEAGAWGVLVSEFMLQQTPVSRVLPVYSSWLERWPTPAALASEPSGEAIRAWGRLGYPRRALRLHACATAICERYGGRVPSEVDILLGLPGIGAYTARAVAAFAYGQRVPVVDTNVRRVVARAVTGTAEAGPPSTTRDLATVEALLPPTPLVAARFSAALMELGALICTARTPRCPDCPLAGQCQWRLTGSPAHDGPKRRTQTYAGTDRQVRGLLLAALRNSGTPVAQRHLDLVWPDQAQRTRSLDGLVADGLVDLVGTDHYALPGISF
jgi:A/G-specific adenine glycosylase